MILISAVLAIGALGALVIGWFQDGLTMVYVSIGVSVAALVSLIVGLVRSRAVTPATAGGPYGPEQGSAAAASAPAEPRDRVTPRAPLPQRRPAAKRPTGRPERTAAAARTAEEEPPAQPHPKKPAAKRPAAKKAPAKKSTSRKPAAKKSTSRKPAAQSPRSKVVSIPERGTFHRPDCRFVKGRRDIERITLATAEKRRYSSCGVCKPDQG